MWCWRFGGRGWWCRWAALLALRLQPAYFVFRVCEFVRCGECKSVDRLRQKAPQSRAERGLIKRTCCRRLLREQPDLRLEFCDLRLGLAQAASGATVGAHSRCRGQSRRCHMRDLEMCDRCLSCCKRESFCGRMSPAPRVMVSCDAQGGRRW